jgi:cytochrome c oxidase subunit IV
MKRSLLYIYIWGVLAALTVAEVLTLLAPLTHTVIALTILASASFKAILIAAFYQHLKYEQNSLKIIPLSILIFIVLFVLLAQLIAHPHLN